MNYITCSCHLKKIPFYQDKFDFLILAAKRQCHCHDSCWIGREEEVTESCLKDSSQRRENKLRQLGD